MCSLQIKHERPLCSNWTLFFFLARLQAMPPSKIQVAYAKKIHCSSNVSIIGNNTTSTPTGCIIILHASDATHLLVWNLRGLTNYHYSLPEPLSPHFKWAQYIMVLPHSNFVGWYGIKLRNIRFQGYQVVIYNHNWWLH